MPWLIDTVHKALRTPKYKYIHWCKHENRNELYDLERDPFEMNNLYGKESMRSVVDELEELLAKEVVKTFGIGEN